MLSKRGDIDSAESYTGELRMVPEAGFVILMASQQRSCEPCIQPGNSEDLFCLLESSQREANCRWMVRKVLSSQPV